MDQFGVYLDDGRAILAQMVLDDAGGLRTVVPTGATGNVTSDVARQKFVEQWLRWAGPPDIMVYDQFLFHI